MIIWLVLLAFLAAAAWSYSFFYYESSQNGHLASLKERFGLAFWPVFLWCMLRGAFSMALAVLLFPTTYISYLWRPKGLEYQSIPVVFVHGYLHNRTGWLLFRWLFKRWGIGPTYAFTFRGSVEEQAGALAYIVNEVTASTGAEKLDLVGHSMGGLVIRRYLAAAGGEKVRRALTLGSPHGGSKLAAYAPTSAGRELLPQSELIRRMREETPLPGGVELFSLYTPFDNMVLPVSSSIIEGPSIKTIELPPMSHISIIYSFAAAKRVREILK